jgi:hypothetical protein
METVMLRMVSAVRRGFRTVFFKMSRIIFIAVLLYDESRPKPSSAEAIPSAALGLCGRKLRRIHPARIQFYHGTPGPWWRLYVVTT